MQIFQKDNLEYRKMNKGYLFSNGIGLNELAFRIWNMCSMVTYEKIENELYIEYEPENDLDKKLIRNDVIRCIEELKDANLIKEV